MFGGMATTQQQMALPDIIVNTGGGVWALIGAIASSLIAGGLLYLIKRKK